MQDGGDDVSTMAVCIGRVVAAKLDHKFKVVMSLDGYRQRQEEDGIEEVKREEGQTAREVAPI